MDDMQRLTSAACGDLERLAAAAATMGYSSDKVVSYTTDISRSSHQITSSSMTQTASETSVTAPNIITQYTLANNVDPYDLSRTQDSTLVRLSDYPSYSYDQTRSPHHHQTTIIPAHTHITSIKNEHNGQQDSHYSSNRNSLSLNSERGQYSLSSITNNSSTAHILIHDGIHYVENKSVASSTINLPLSSSALLSTSSSESLTDIPQPDVSFERVENLEETMNNSVQYIIDKKKKRVKKEPENKSKLLQVLTYGELNPSEVGYQSTEKIDSEEPDDPLHIDVSQIPDPVIIDGKKYIICKLCGAKFIRKYQYTRHQISHTGEKRGALSLETKVEIIKRIQGGEKQVDLAMEYNVGRSTLSFIMKNCEKFLAVWKDGKFHPDTKRLRGAQREDVEEALYEWYKQALQNHTPVSGPILCMKAKDFAAKLGYKEFKATHGWLDRFKHRKNIFIGRGKNKERDPIEELDELKGDFAGQILPSALIEYGTNDVFHAAELGLLYRILPNDSLNFRGNRCAGGSHSKNRLTVLMCTNMTGTEKFPLLVIGKYPKPKCFKNVKSLPVQYLAHPKAWMTVESFSAWLHDLDSWFVQQNRKVLLVLPSLPIHPKLPKLNAVRVITSPPKFIGPSDLGITSTLKRNYRRLILESLLTSFEEEDHKKTKRRNRKTPIKMDLLSCLHNLAASWHAVSEATITISFQRSGISKYGMWGMNLMPETNLGTENLELIHKLRSHGFKMPEAFTFDDFVSFDDDIQVCHLMDDDNIIALVNPNTVDSSDSEEECNDYEEENTSEMNAKENEVRQDISHKEVARKEDLKPTFSEVEAKLGILRKYIKVQEGASDMLQVLDHLEYLIQNPTLTTPAVNGNTDETIPLSESGTPRITYGVFHLKETKK